MTTDANNIGPENTDDQGGEAMRYRWRYFAPGDEPLEEDENPLFLVFEDVEDPDEYSGFQDFAYNDFGLVDVMAYSYEPRAGRSPERVLELLRADSRMIEDESIEF